MTPIPKNRLDEIAAIPDEKIDTSDIPEATPEWFARAEWKTPRWRWALRLYAAGGRLLIEVMLASEAAVAAEVEASRSRMRRRDDPAAYAELTQLVSPFKRERIDAWGSEPR